MSLVSGIYSLAPGWSSVFDKWDGLKKYQREAITYDISQPHKTPVCEAHNWNVEYFDKTSPKFCDECSWFSWSYNYVINGERMDLDQEIVKLKGEQFCDHWIHRHNGHAPKKKSAHRK